MAPNFRTAEMADIVARADAMIASATAGKPLPPMALAYQGGDAAAFDVAQVFDGTIRISVELGDAEISLRGLTNQDAHELAGMLIWLVAERQAKAEWLRLGHALARVAA